VVVRKGIPHNHVDLPSLVWIGAAGVCIATGNSEVLLWAVYKSPGHSRNDRGITEFLSFRHKSVQVGDLNAKRTFWNSVVSNQPGAKLLNLLHINEFEICNTVSHSPTGNGDVFDIVVHKNIRLSEVIVSDILDSDHLSVVFRLLDHVRTWTHSQIGSDIKASPQN
jgi:hypothetical protein